MRGSRYNILGVILLSIFSSCSDDTDPEVLPEEELLSPANAYFVEVTFGGGTAGQYRSISKWDSDLKIFVPQTQYIHLNEELDSIISELNRLSRNMNIKKVSYINDANFIAYFGNHSEYVEKYEPNAAFIPNKESLFWIYTSNWSIYKGSLFVDIVETESIDCQKHILREKLTQSLGLLYTSTSYPTSIFYDEESCVNDYSELDAQLIKLLTDPNIEPGMSRAMVIEYLKSLQIII